MPIEHIKLSQQAKDQLQKLKRRTGIEHWNVLCRWAFCLSLAEPSVPADSKLPADSNLEMTWKVFGGAHQEILLAMLKERCLQDSLGIEDEALAKQLRLHLYRGIGYLAGNKGLKSISDLIAYSVREST